jgi:chemotaxis protein methyltransferase CheR
MVELGIVDIREIIRLIKNQYDIDFSTFALTSLKYRLEHIIAKNNLSSPESLYRKLTDHREFFDTFIHQLFVPSSEMFRDPSVWRWLREEYFSRLHDEDLINFKIWLPYCVSGGELYTLCILLQELNLLGRVKIIATIFSDTSLDYIKSGEYPLKKIEISAENYTRIQSTGEFADYYNLEQYTARRDTSLIKNVEFIKDDINFSKAPKNVKLILMRNVMIYFNPSYQEYMLGKVHNILTGSGNLLVGLKELIRSNQNSHSLFETVESSESIYRKKLT